MSPTTTWKYAKTETAAFEAYADHVPMDCATEENFQKAYCGEWDSEQAFAKDLFGELTDIPEHIVPYINYKMFTSDLFTNDFFSIKSDSGVYVFYNC